LVRTAARLIAEYSSSLSFRDLPEQVVREVVRRFVDSLGVMYGSHGSEPLEAARKAAERFASGGPSSLFGSKTKSSPDWAAFVNGVAVRYLDFNDTYLSREALHPSDMIPGLLALAEALGATGRDLIASIAVAYEVALALADTATLRDRGYDHVAYIAIGAAAGASRLLGLDPERAEQAVNIAGVNAAALRQTRAGELSMWKGCAAANASRHGVFAALLASNGMTGPSPIFEGEMGFWRVVAGGMHQLPRLGGVDGEPFRLLRTSIKRWPVEYHSMSAVEAAIRIKERIGSAAIESIEIATFTVSHKIIAKDPEKWRPRTRETADHSLPYITVRTLLDGDIWTDSYTPDKLSDPRLLELMSRTRVEVDPRYDEIYPEAVPNRVSVRTSDGRTVTEEVIYPSGHFRNPMTDRQLSEKFLRLASPVLGRERAEELHGLAWRLPDLDDLSRITSHFAL